MIVGGSINQKLAAYQNPRNTHLQCCDVNAKALNVCQESPTDIGRAASAGTVHASRTHIPKSSSLIISSSAW